jgi:hypothetical protein
MLTSELGGLGECLDPEPRVDSGPYPEVMRW